MFAAAILQGFEAAKNDVSAPTPTPQALQTTNPDQSAIISADLNANGAVSTSPQLADHTVLSITSITPSQATSNVQVKVYDTYTIQPLAALLNQAQQDGATLVIGQLLKENVNQLSDNHTTLNVLALNQTETPNDDPNTTSITLHRCRRRMKRAMQPVISGTNSNANYCC